MNDQDWKARVDLAAAFRLAAYFGFHEGICNHFSYAVQGAEDRFLLNPYGFHWSELRASDLLLVDSDGRVLEGKGDAETTALCIHVPLHQRHSRARCVLHTHMPYATALTTMEDGELEPVHQNALRFYKDVAYDREYHGLVVDKSEGERLSNVFENKRVLFMQHHGVIVVGESIAAAFDDLYYLERACHVQILAASTGRRLKRVPDNVAGAAFAGWSGSGGSSAEDHFRALKRVLDRVNPGYAE